MKDQHEKIKGYRDLNQNEIDAINDVKQAEAELGELYRKVVSVSDTDKRWASIARTHFEEGFSALVRSIARPDPNF